MRGLAWSADRLHQAENDLRTNLGCTGAILAATLDGRLELRVRPDRYVVRAVETIRKREDSDLGLSPRAARLLLECSRRHVTPSA